MFNPCAVIPVYDHEQAVGAVVDGILRHSLRCILVDDGSGPKCARALAEVAAASPDRVTLIRHSNNAGKGSAVLTGIRYAAQAGYTHALQIDADGQHRVCDVPRFIALAAENPSALIVGHPRYDNTMPSLRRYARRLTHLWVCINTLSRQIGDSMCGFRVYPVSAVIALDQRVNLGRRMNFDIDIVVRLYWAGLRIINVPTPVVYPSDGVSHFRGWLDNILISRVHATLFFGMLRRLPMLLARRWTVL
jgi:glycosyltransferase involved in cell wall biosynthesis